MWSNVIPNGNNCVEMLRNLCPVSPSMYYVGVTKVWSWAGDRLQGSQEMAVEMGGSRHHTPSQLFLKEQLYQVLESKRARAHHLAALTLQRYARTFFIMRRFRSLRRKIILLQSRARGYLARWGPRRGAVGECCQVAEGDGCPPAGSGTGVCGARSSSSGRWCTST